MLNTILLMGQEHLDRLPIAGVLARGARAGIVVLVIGAVLVLVGVLRLVGFFPGLRLNVLGPSRLSPALQGLLGLLIGVALVVVGIVLLNR